jgi:hypothetical protein
MKRPGALFLVRHGESGWNRKRLIQGQSRAAPGLTVAGRTDAVADGGNLADSGAVFILASDLRRLWRRHFPSLPGWACRPARAAAAGTASRHRGGAPERSGGPW